MPEGEIRRVHRLEKCPGIKRQLHVPISFHPSKALKDKNKLHGFVHDLEGIAIWGPENKQYSKEIEKYLDVTRSCENPVQYKVEVKKDVLNRELRTAGWLFLVSGYDDDPHSAIRVYRNRDYVEKGFDRFKNNFDYGHLRVHSGERTENKLFCGFIASILGCALDNAIRADLYSTYTMGEMLIKTSQIRMAAEPSQ